MQWIQRRSSACSQQPPCRAAHAHVQSHDGHIRPLRVRHDVGTDALFSPRPQKHSVPSILMDSDRHVIKRVSEPRF